ncbi:MAG: hypothetical protein ABW217_02855 [Polyangiaceae bacterium]
MYQQDFLKRAIEQLGAALARALGLAAEKKPAAALQVLRDARSELPIGPSMIEELDVVTLVDKLGPDSAETLARILALEADLQEQLGRGMLAERPRKRSGEITAALARRAGQGEAGSPQNS